MDKKIFKVLIVEDEPDIAQALASFLPKKLNVAASIAVDGIEAVKMARELEPDLIFLDIHLPGEMGANVLRQIRDFDTHVKIVITTGIFVVPEEDEEVILGQTSGYLVKPVKMDVIINKVVEELGLEVVRK
ncbi:MAG: response regulator [Candidatus Omnitrophota bacterium]